MLSPQELGHLTDNIEKIWQELEDEALADMAQRIVKMITLPHHRGVEQA